MEEKTLSLHEAAAVLHMSPLTLRKWAAAGRLPAYKLGKAWLFLLDELCEFLKAHKRCLSIAAPTLRTSGVVSRLTAGKSGSQLAQQIAAKFETAARSRAWRQAKLGERPPYPWSAAHKRWLAETQKRTKAKDEATLRWFDEHLKDADVQGITREVIDELRALKAEEASQATADRYMALLRAILRKCVNEWGVLDAAPKVPMYRPRVAEPRFLTRAEFERLAQEMPEHLRLRAWCAVLTGLRMRSMLSLEWSRIDLKARRAWIPGEQMKAGRTHGLPLSTAAIDVLKELRKLSPDSERVFTWRGKPVDDCNGKAFKDAVKRAGLEPLRWHDLRHTWASWAVQGGVTLHELMQLGGWSSYQMVLRYAHLAPDHLAGAAEKVSIGAKYRRRDAHVSSTATRTRRVPPPVERS